MTELDLFPASPARIYTVPREITDSDEWIVQLKKDGRRCVIRCTGENEPVSFFTRHGDPMTVVQDWQWLKNVLPPPFVVDGEELGSRQAGEKRNRLVLWDCILLGGQSMLGCEYQERRDLIALHIENSPNGLLPWIDELFENLTFVPARLKGIQEAGFAGCWLRHIWRHGKRYDSESFEGQTISVLADLPADKWRWLWDQTSVDGIDEGVVFKKATAPIAWHRQPNREDCNQLKLRRKG